VEPAANPPADWSGRVHRRRWTEILALLTAEDPRAALVERICEVSVARLGVSGAGMCLVAGRRHQVIVHGTDPLIQELEDLQVTLGQGPCIEAVRSGQPVLAPSLAEDRPPSWDRYAEQALARGVRALFAFPLHAGPTRFGSLDLYRLTPGPLDTQASGDAEILTDIANRAMLAQRDRIHLDGSVSALNWLSGPPSDLPDSALAPRGRAVDLGITVEQAVAPPWLDRADATSERSSDPLPDLS